MTSQSFKLGPTTSRTADFLSRKYGFESVAELAASLPKGAQVLDVGSGASPFGRDVAKLRPDVSWTNFDYSYSDPKILDEVTKGSPDNVRYISGDATRLTQFYMPETFDAIFSYWMMPHLSIYSPEPAKKAARAIFTLARKGAVISIGPVVNKDHTPLILNSSTKAYKITKGKDLNADSFADMVVVKTKLPRFTRFTQKTANEVVTQLLGTTRWAIQYGKIPKNIYHPKSGEYVSLFSLRGMHTVISIVTTLFRHIVTRRKSKSS